MSGPLLQVEGLVKRFSTQGGRGSRTTVDAVAGVDLEVRRGEVLSLVGESGSGKTTLARCVLALERPTEGTIRFDGVDVHRADRQALAAVRRRMQPVFQDPYSSLDPRWSVERTVREALDVHRIGTKQERAERVKQVLERVGLPARFAQRRPHELSGGQRQRVGIAAALAPNPELLIADEPVTALDVSVQAQVLNLLHEIQRDLNLTILLVAHDLAVVSHISDRVAVMYLGEIVELGTRDEVFDSPSHEYTEALLDAMPAPR